MKKLIGILSLLILIGVGVMFAFWASTVYVDAEEDSLIINIGKPNAVTTTIDVNAIAEKNENAILVPTSGAVDNSASNNGKQIIDYLFVELLITWNGDTSNLAGLYAGFNISELVTLDPALDEDEISDSDLKKAEGLINVMFLVSDDIDASISALNQFIIAAQTADDNRNYITAKDISDGIKADQYNMEELAQNDFFTLYLGVEFKMLMIIYIDPTDANTIDYIKSSTITVDITISLDPKNSDLLNLD